MGGWGQGDGSPPSQPQPGRTLWLRLKLYCFQTVPTDSLDFARGIRARVVSFVTTRTDGEDPSGVGPGAGEPGGIRTLVIFSGMDFQSQFDRFR